VREREERRDIHFKIKIPAVVRACEKRFSSSSFLLVLIRFPHPSFSSPSYSSRDLLAKFLIDLKPLQEGNLQRINNILLFISSENAAFNENYARCFTLAQKIQKERTVLLCVVGVCDWPVEN
jgi:hypothetical protein